MHAILGSLGGALAVASRVGGLPGTLLAQAARTAFMTGNQAALAASAGAAFAGACLALALLPAQRQRRRAMAAGWRAVEQPQVTAK